jgi:dienelactone hydrolase
MKMAQAVLSLALVLVGVEAYGKPLMSMATAPTGTVEFHTLTLTSADFLSSVKTGQPITISGELTIPQGDGRVPAIIMSHGNGGIAGAERAWVTELRSQGFAVFLVDSFTGRRITRGPSEAQLSRVGQVYDVYQALALLATHPRIDPARIGLMGSSRAGGLTVFSATARARNAQLPTGVDFCGYLALYPSIIEPEANDSLAVKPMRIFAGTADERNPIAGIRTFTEKARAAGADVKLFEYEGAHHSFDDSAFRSPVVVRGSRSFTVAYHPQAHTKMKQDMKETLPEIFSSR